MKSNQEFCDEWNRKNPEGTRISYQLIIGISEPFITKTRSKAWLTGDGEPIVSIEGKSGGCSISHMTVIEG